MGYLRDDSGNEGPERVLTRKKCVGEEMWTLKEWKNGLIKDT